MDTKLKLDRFAKYAWFVLAYNIVVILVGRFSSRFKIGRRLRTALADVRRRSYSKCAATKNRHRIFAPHHEFARRNFYYRAGRLGVCKLVFPQRRKKKIFTVYRYRLVCFCRHRRSARRGFGFDGQHGGNFDGGATFLDGGAFDKYFILLAFLTLTAWFASGGKPFNFKTAQPKVLLFLAIALFGIFFIGMSGSVAALSSMLFPSETLAEGMAKDFSTTSNILLRLRIAHPILSIITSVFLIFLAGWLRREAKENVWVLRFSNLLSILILIQIAFGALTLLTLAPILMQLGHLFLADAVWISFVLLSASFLAENQNREQDLN